jgi:hypothetical protein
MKNFITLTIVLFTFILNAQSDTSLTIEEIKVLHNTQWTGELMYVNYGDGKEVTLETRMQIDIKKNKIVMRTQYVNEPSANSKSTIKLKKNGTYFGNEKLVEKSISADGTLTLVTTYEGRDNNEPATIYNTFVFDGYHFSITKEVLFKDAEKRFIRNKSTYTKL